MKFLCGSCRTKYQISDDKVRGKILTIRCKKCGSKILVRESLSRDGTAVAPIAEDEREEVAVQERALGKARVGGAAALASAFEVAIQSGGDADDMPTSIAPVPANLEIAGVEWYVAIDGQQQGPFAFAEVVRRIAGKEILPRHYAWHDGMDNWLRVREIKDLAPYVPAQAASGKKKPPPPPPNLSAVPKEAEVLDFASKRAERQRAKTDDLVEGGLLDAKELDPTAHDAKAVALPPVSTTSERAEQLDHVLNEALGIEGEGKTARADAAQAVGGDAPPGMIGPGKAEIPVLEDLLAFDGKDDIFANVPRASEAELVQRESTRFFVAAAGVNRQRSRKKLGMIAAGVGGLLVIGFVSLVATGTLHIPIIGPFGSGEASEDELAYDDEEGSAEDPNRLKNLLGGQRSQGTKPKRAAAAVKTAAAQRAPSSALPEPSGDYVDEQGRPLLAERSGPRGERGVELVGVDGVLPKSLGASGVTEAQLPRARVEDLPPTDGVAFSHEAVARVINMKKKSVSICYEQSLRAKEDLRGKLELKVTVEPSGKVSRAVVETTAFKGSKLGRCIEDKIKEWRFPTFEGEAEHVLVPFILEKSSYE